MSLMNDTSTHVKQTRGGSWNAQGFLVLNPEPNFHLGIWHRCHHHDTAYGLLLVHYHAIFHYSNAQYQPVLQERRISPESSHW